MHFNSTTELLKHNEIYSTLEEHRVPLLHPSSGAAQAQARLNVLADACKALSAPLAGKSGTKRLATALARVAKVPRCSGGSTPGGVTACTRGTPVLTGAAHALTIDLTAAASQAAALKPGSAEREVRCAMDADALNSGKAYNNLLIECGFGVEQICQANVYRDLTKKNPVNCAHTNF